MLSPRQLGEVHERLQQITTLAREIEEVPSVGPDRWTTRDIDQKCQQVRQHAHRVSTLVGTGDVPRHTNVPDGATVVNSGAAADIQVRVQQISALAVEIEQVPDFSPDIWSMRDIDKKCQDIADLSQQVWVLLHASSTGA